jgi:hypothetical protein
MSERDIFDAALAMGDPDQRAAYLDRTCAGNPGLGEHIDGLLSADGQVGSFLEAPALGAVATRDEPAGERPGTVIGPYRLMEQIGEGGMGLVFVAEQQQPVRRKVALKVLKPGMDTRQVVARFEAERQALALMDHPHIARVFDGGTTPAGRPYFVMELVKGLPITEYCDRNGLPVRGSGWGCSWTSAVECSTRTRRGSSTGTSSRATCWSSPTTPRRWPRSSTSARMTANLIPTAPQTRSLGSLSPGGQSLRPSPSGYARLISQQTRGAAPASRSRSFCHPRPVNGFSEAP